MFGLIFRRSLHISRASMTASRTSVLAKLRKSTGYPLTNCKKALELFPDNVTKAEEWLHGEAKSKGWSKWAKIQTRTATQGLIGVCSKDNIGVMLEINCETDFVSRNSEFQQLVEKMLSGCISYASNLNLDNDITKAVLDESQLSTISCENATLGELVVTAAMKFNEKTVAKRAVFLKVPDDILLNCLTHPANICPNLDGASLGRYGALLAFKEEKTDITNDITSLKLDLCNHIIGMNPLSIGQLTEKDIARFTKKLSEESEIGANVPSEHNTENVACQQPEGVQSVLFEHNTENVNHQQNSEAAKSEENVESSDDSQTEGQETIDTKLKESNEKELLFQPYLLDPTVTVGETLFKSGINVVAFERFQCGETLEESPDDAVAASG